MTIATIEALLNFLQDTRAQLDIWGVTTGNLLAVGAVALTFFFLSLREVLDWYLKTDTLREEMIRTRHQLSLLQKTVEEMRIVLTHTERSPIRPVEPPMTAGEQTPTAVGGFQLNH